MTKFAVRSKDRCGGEHVSLLSEHLKTEEGTIKMCGFPATELMTVLDPTMLLPQSNMYVPYTEWLTENKDCELPNDITMIVLMCMYQKNANSTPSALMSSAGSSLPKYVITASDLRRVLHSSDIESAMNMFYNRARKIYKRCEQSIMKQTNGTQRVNAFSSYIESTAIPLANATAKSDNGTNGGKDPRVSIYNDIGEFVHDDEGTTSSFMSHIFTDSIGQVMQDFGDDINLCLQECPHSLLHSLFLYNATLVNVNRNYNLKGNNSQLITMIWISDAGLSIAYNEGNIEMAKNGIGHTLHVADFNRCAREFGSCGEDDTNKSKKWGVGVDNTINVYKSAQHPRNNQCPILIDTSSYPDIDSWIGSSEMGLWNTYTELVTRNGKRLNTITQVPPLVYCTELPVSDSKTSNAANPTSSMYGKIATLIARQTETCSGAKRSYTTKNEQTQNMESAVQIQKYYMKLLLVCHNEHTNDPKSITVQAVTTPVPSATVDIDDSVKDVSLSNTQQQAQDDMGDCSKFISCRNNSIITKAHPFFFCVQGLAQVL
jgi:hypothetical protein